MSRQSETFSIQTADGTTADSKLSGADTSGSGSNVSGFFQRLWQRRQPLVEPNVHPDAAPAPAPAPAPAASDSSSPFGFSRPTTPSPADIAAAAQQGARSTVEVEEAIDLLEQRRIGPYAAVCGNIALLHGLIFAFLRGHWCMAKNDHAGAMRSQRHRFLIVGPMLAAFVTSNNLVVPLPFKESIERATGRKAVTISDILAAEKYMKAQDEAWNLYNNSEALKARPNGT